MIISHSRQYIFFAVPKTGTHAMRELLHASMDPTDWEQQALFEQKRIPIAQIARLKHGHISVKQIQPYLTEHQWRSYFKFGIVRNPYDRFISVCFFLNRQNPEFNSNPVTWMKSALARDRFKQLVLVKPQSLQLLDQSGSIGLDYVGRYEFLQRAADSICRTLSLPDTVLATKNHSEHEAFETYYDQELRELVADFYALDFDTFDYSIDARPG